MTVQHPDTPTIRAPRAWIAAGVVLAAVASAGAGSAAADPAGLTLRYMCSLPPFPAQAMTVVLTWNAPDSVMVGQPAPILPVNATATMGAIVTQGLGIIGAATVEGTVDATGVVVTPEGDLSATVPLAVPRTQVPSAGPITVEATGTTPVFVFHRSGHATITVGNRLAVRLIPKNASGTPTIGQVNASCALNSGEHNVLSSFDITEAKTTPIPTTGRAAGPTAPGVGGATAPGTAGTVAPGPSGPVSSPTASSALGSEVSGTAQPQATATPNPAFAIAATAGLTAVDPRLVGGAILAAGIGVFGFVWWLNRRRRQSH